MSTMEDGGSNAFGAGGRSYPVNWAIASERLRCYNPKPRLEIAAGRLMFDGRHIRFRDGVEMRDIWEAVEWRGWIICLGRTSATDEMANLRPAFFANELIVFRPSDSSASHKFLAPHQPVFPGIIILDPR